MGCRKLSYYEREGLEKNTFFSVVGSEKRETEHFFGVDYYPYGKVLREFQNGLGAEKYLTTHHERDTETGLDYRGARYYDADVARFLSLDPKAMDYANISAYNYVAGNPIFLIDPDGRDLFIAGNKQFVRQSFRELKRLTNAKLALNRSDGQVSIVKENARNLSKQLNYGTNLVKEIIEKKDIFGRGIKATITDKNGAIGMQKTELGRMNIQAQEGSMTVPNGGHPIIVNDFGTGKGIIQNSDGTTGRPSFIGLGHELIHALRIMSLIEIPYQDTESLRNTVDPDTKEKGTLSQEEIKVRGEENKLRDEQDVKERATPTIEKPNYDFD